MVIEAGFILSRSFPALMAIFAVGELALFAGQAPFSAPRLALLCIVASPWEPWPQGRSLHTRPSCQAHACNARGLLSCRACSCKGSMTCLGCAQAR